MNDVITKVFLVVGVLVFILIAWQLLWSVTGILPKAYNAVADKVNDVYSSSRGVDSKILPLYGDTTNGFTNGKPTITAADFEIYHY